MGCSGGPGFATSLMGHLDNGLMHPLQTQRMHSSIWGWAGGEVAQNLWLRGAPMQGWCSGDWQVRALQPLAGEGPWERGAQKGKQRFPRN